MVMKSVGSGDDGGKEQKTAISGSSSTPRTDGSISAIHAMGEKLSLLKTGTMQLSQVEDRQWMLPYTYEKAPTFWRSSKSQD